MNTNLQVFQFENSSIRIVELEDVVWFVAGEISNILGYSQTANALKLCRKASVLDELNKINGLAPATKWIPESDLYRLVMRSQQESAEKFQDWVVEEVLPSIRKTGQYQVSQMQPLALTQHDLATRQLENEFKVAALFECPKHLMQQEAVKRVRKDTGVDFSDYLKYAPAQQNILQHEIMLEPTELAKKVGLKSANAMNRCLKDLWLQDNIDGQWTPTIAGHSLCQRHAWSKGSKSGYNLKWNVTAIEELLEE